MATIKPIEARSVHQIQSGQVIVDLCSVVKELVENSLDAGATSVEVRFKNNGLDSIEVHDNGSGISPSNYESLALKHHTSKLASYDDLSSLQTFGFRGEALSSLCALSTFSVITALADEAPKGKKLDFESSGKLKETTVVAAQKGTITVVEGLFEQLPVRRKELTKNIKNQYGKVLGLLHAYACICINVKFTVKSAMPKGKNATVFATKGNPTTRENIANVYGTKTLSALVPLELQLEFQRKLCQKDDAGGPASKIVVRGHISRPVFGEGRQTPDRQMFFVNGRPCGLPQISKAFNEVYKSFNVSQSPFIFADLEMDTNAYDVNVSPDKRTIMLHDSAVLVETLKTCLTELFDQQEQTMPQSQVQTSRLPAYKQLKISRESTVESIDSNGSGAASLLAKASLDPDEAGERTTFLHDFFTHQASTREEPEAEISRAARSRGKEKLVKALGAEAKSAPKVDEHDDLAELRDTDKASDRELPEKADNIRVRDFNLRMAEQQTESSNQRPMSGTMAEQSDSPVAAATLLPPRTNAIQSAFDKIRPTRPVPEMATITVGDKTITTMVGTHKPALNAKKVDTGANHTKTRSAARPSNQAFTQRIIGFAAPGVPGSQVGAEPDNEAESGSENQDLGGSDDDSTSEKASSTASNEERDDGNSEDDAGNDEGGPFESPNYDTDGEYVDESEKKAREDATVAELIRAAEEKAASVKVNSSRRGNKAFKSGSHKDSTVGLQIRSAISVEQVRELTKRWELTIKENPRSRAMLERGEGVDDKIDDEERLALTVSKADFSSMHIVGQFNLGFILAVRPSSDTKLNGSGTKDSDELFIVDQHASDEKYNFERLQRETVVGNQRLVRPKQLDLTAVEEEILIENSMALEKNGFLVHIDTEGEEAIGQRCKLISLPLSKEVTFGLEDLEELLHLLSESPGLSQSSMVPRPSKVRKMFAMRACRSSIMIGKALSENKMKTVVSHMGEIDKPWNCPHGRPTMRHLMTLSSIEPWQEGDGISGVAGFGGGDDIWSRYVQDE
jgi:DNA mismatch repair protein PMS2